MPLEEFNRYLHAWVKRSTTPAFTAAQVRHRWTAGRTPLSRLCARSHRTCCSRRSCTGVAALSTTGEVKFLGNLYFADPALAHQTVIIRYDPFDLSTVWLWQEGQAMHRLTADRLVTRAAPWQENRKARSTPRPLADSSTTCPTATSASWPGKCG